MNENAAPLARPAADAIAVDLVADKAREHPDDSEVLFLDATPSLLKCHERCRVSLHDALGP